MRNLDFYVDCHFHDKSSDGDATSEEIIDEILRKYPNINIDNSLFIPTNHDIINYEFKKLAAESFGTAEGVEISARDDKNKNKSTHLVAYANHFGPKLISIIENVRKGKIGKLKKQCMLLADNGFDIKYNEFVKKYVNEGFKEENLNNAHIADYIYSKKHKIENEKTATIKKYLIRDFIKEVLSRGGKDNKIGSVNVPEYEPTIDQLGEIKKNENFFLGIAHPNFTFYTHKNFNKFIENYIDKLDGIEVNTLASKKWVKLIIETSLKFNKILTFGSDDHFTGEDDKHGNIGERNKYITNIIFQENVKKFKKIISS